VGGKILAADKLAREEWVEEDWGQTVNAYVRSAGKRHPTREGFPVLDRSVPNVGSQ